MQNQVRPEIKEQRSKKLIQLSDKNEEEYNKKYIGKYVDVLWEEEKNNIYKGHTKNYILVEQEQRENTNKENTIEKVKIINAENHQILA